MPFTSTCAISGTVWDGPSGCPIISPSNWQTYVVTNLCILALHNHSGSAGEGASLSGSWFPAIDDDQFTTFFPTASTNWTLNNAGNWMMDGNVSTTTQSATIAYDVYLRSGTYTLGIISGCGAGNGILTACLNGVGAATINCYDSVSSSNVSASVSFTASGAGERLLVFTPDTKNVSSTGYALDIAYVSIIRTGN